MHKLQPGLFGVILLSGCFPSHQLPVPGQTPTPIQTEANTNNDAPGGGVSSGSSPSSSSTMGSGDLDRHRHHPKPTHSGTPAPTPSSTPKQPTPSPTSAPISTPRPTPTPTPKPTVAPTVPPTSGSGSASSFTWKGHTWNVTNGGMAGVAQGSIKNVFVDSNGYLHLQINKGSSGWTAAEVFTADNLGFGTYLWQIQGPIDNLDKSTVLGIFPYGPAAGIGVDGENELDTEFSRWNQDISSNASFTYYPSTGNRSVGSVSKSFDINLDGENLATVQMEWSSTSVTGTIQLGLQPMYSSSQVLGTFTFAPGNPSVRIPQTAVPLGMNLWCFETTPATNQEVIIRDFQFVKGQ